MNREDEFETISINIVAEWAYGILTSNVYPLLPPETHQTLVDKIAKHPIWSRRTLQDCSGRLTPKQIQQLQDASTDEKIEAALTPGQVKVE